MLYLCYEKKGDLVDKNLAMAFLTRAIAFATGNRSNHSGSVMFYKGVDAFLDRKWWLLRLILPEEGTIQRLLWAVFIILVIYTFKLEVVTPAFLVQIGVNH